MLAALRTNTKAILWIVVLAFLGFIFAAWGRGLQRSRSGPSRGMVGVVGNTSVRYDDYAEALRANIKAYGAQAGGGISDDVLAAIEDQTWQTMVGEILVNQEIDRMGIAVADDHVFDVLWNNPPDAVLRSPAFQRENGEFDFDLYHREIEMHPERWEDVAEYYRRMLKQQILQQEIQTAAFVSDNEVWSEYVTQNQKVMVSYVAVEAAAVGVSGVMPTDEEARAYFEEHRAEYERPEMASLAFVRFQKVATAEDEQDVVERLSDLADAVRDGEDFGEIAKVYSEHPTASSGGDLGYVKKGAMPPEFDQVVDGLAVGQISQPVKTAQGYYVIRLEDRRRTGGETEAHLRVILATVRPSEQTVTAIEEEATALLRRAQGAGLAAAADSAGLAVEKTPLFEEGRIVPGVGNAPTAVALAFQERPGFAFGPMTTGDAVYAFEVAEKTKKGIPTYDEIEAEAQATGSANPVKLALAAERQGEKARGIAEGIANATRSGRALEEAAAAAGLSVRQTPLFSRRDFVPGVGRGNEFIGAAFGIPVGSIAGPIRTEKPERYYIIRAEGGQQATQEGFAPQRVELANQVLQRKRQELLAAWMDGLMKRTKVEDYRNVYFASGGQQQQQPPANVGYGY
jgi:parvulin-like peptidyl-prolyl isomerase